MDLVIAWRIALLILALVTFGFLIQRYILCRKQWNNKTKDYWYALMMWCITSMVVAISGIQTNNHANIRLIFVSAATLGTLIGVTKKGQWGGDD